MTKPFQKFDEKTLNQKSHFILQSLCSILVLGTVTQFSETYFKLYASAISKQNLNNILQYSRLLPNLYTNEFLSVE